MRDLVFSIVLLLMLCACGRSGSARAESVDLRITTFNIAMGLPEEHQLSQALAHGQDLRLRQVAEILQEVGPYIVLLNEFDYDPDIAAAGLFWSPSEDTRLIDVSDHRLVWLDIS